MSDIGTISSDAAKLNLNSVLDSRNRFMDEVSANFRWILATLASLNGGAVVAALSADSISNVGKILGCQWFLAGIVSSVFLGFFQMIAGTIGGIKLNGILDFWVRGVESLVIDLEEHRRLRHSLFLWISPWVVLSYAAGFASIGCLIRGAYVVGAHLQ